MYPPKTMEAPHVILASKRRYHLVTLMIPPGVIVNEDMLGAIANLRYSYHDITNLPDGTI